MTILVTGATGLVGERLIPRLLEAGHACRALVRRPTALPGEVEQVHGELSDRDSLAAAVAGVSAVVHLAAVFRTDDDQLIWRSNLDGTRNLIAAVRSHAPDARFIMASTTNVYDVDCPRPSREDDPVTPSHAYPASKLAAEHELAASGLAWSVLRFGFVYGDGDGHIESMATLAAQGQARFHPAMRMSVVHHRDIAQAVRLALAGRFDGRVVNIADDAPAAMYELFGLVGEAMEPSSEPLPMPWRLQVDNSLARSLGFHPEVHTVFEAARAGTL